MHVGYSKCGSTTLQDTLTANYSWLLEQKVLFPKALSDSPSWLRFFWEKNLPVSYPKGVVASRFQRFSDDLREELLLYPVDTVILSDEGIISLSEESMVELRVFLEEYFPEFEIHIVIIVREPISFFTSRTQQYISDRYFDEIAIQEFFDGRNITNGESRADNSAMNPASFYSKPISRFYENFSNVHVLQFERLIEGRCGLTSSFLKSCGLDVGLDDQRKNESRSSQSIELIAYVNRIFPFPKERRFKQVKRYYGDVRALCSISGDKFKLHRSVVDDLCVKTFSEVEWLRSRCGVDYRSVVAQANDEPIVWGDVFFRDIVRIYPDQRLAIQFAILSFVRERCALLSDPVSVDTFKKVLKWIECHYPCSSRIRLPVLGCALRVERILRRIKKKRFVN